jgi:hypothetical protein
MHKIEQAVEVYLARLHRLRSTGGATAETSFYSPLEDLLNAIGHDLKPKVPPPESCAYGTGPFGVCTNGFSNLKSGLSELGRSGMRAVPVDVDAV